LYKLKDFFSSFDTTVALILEENYSLFYKQILTSVLETLVSLLYVEWSQQLRSPSAYPSWWVSVDRMFYLAEDNVIQLYNLSELGLSSSIHTETQSTFLHILW